MIHRFLFALSVAVLLCGCTRGVSPVPTLEVISISPSDGSVLVSESAVTVSFNAEVAAESVARNNNVFIVNAENQVLRVSITVSGSTVTIAPTGGFASGSIYGVGVTTGVRDLAGGRLRYPRASRFSTGETLSEIPGFPPFTVYPLAPDAARIVAEIRGALVEVRGQSDSVERPQDGKPVNVNLRNLTAGGDWVAVSAGSTGDFSCDLPAGDDGDLIEISASFPWNGTTGPSVEIVAAFPFSWSPIAAGGTAPSARQGHSAVLDAAAGRMLVFGGCSNAFGFGGALDDLHSLSLSAGSETWTELSPSGTGPSARFGHSAVVDASGNRMIVFGGDNGALGVLNDAWQLDLSPGAEAWTQLAPSGPPPDARAFHCAVFDASSQRMLVFCGRGALNVTSPQFDDAWALSLPTSGTPAWSQLAPTGTGPIARNGAFAVIDSGGQNIYAGFGGNGALYLPDTYTFSLQTLVWSPILSIPTSSGRGWPAAVFDSVHQRVLLFGGADASTAYQDLFQYAPAAGSWTTLEPEGAVPAARASASMVFDAANGRSVLFGGREGLAGQVFADLHQLR